MSLELKTERVLVFEGGVLRIKPDGNGTMTIKEEDLRWDYSDTNHSRLLLLPASEIAAIQEFLNKCPRIINQRMTKLPGIER